MSRDAWEPILDDLAARRAAARAMGGAERLERQHQGGRLDARARVDHLLDDGSLVPGNFDQEQEDEADWLAGTLLLPRPALMSIRERYLVDSEACREYGVSQDMLNWRIRMTGIDYQLARSCQTTEPMQL